MLSVFFTNQQIRLKEGVFSPQPVLPAPDAGTLARVAEPGRAGGRRARENAENAEKIP
jgi:hypothetical protein